MGYRFNFPDPQLLKTISNTKRAIDISGGIYSISQKMQLAKSASSSFNSINKIIHTFDYYSQHHQLIGSMRDFTRITNIFENVKSELNYCNMIIRTMQYNNYDLERIMSELESYERSKKYSEDAFDFLQSILSNVKERKEELHKIFLLYLSPILHNSQSEQVVVCKQEIDTKSPRGPPRNSKKNKIIMTSKVVLEFIFKKFLSTYFVILSNIVDFIELLVKIYKIWIDD